MRGRRQLDPLDRFFWAFFKAGRGQILALASKEEHVRDGMALARLARLFPSDEFAKIVVEPSRSGARLEGNVIFVGATPLFLKRAVQAPGRRPRAIATVPESKIGAPLDELSRKGCFQIEGTEERVIVNAVTREEFRPVVDRVNHVTEDFAVLRRVFRNQLGNTITFEGVHRLGTYAAVKFATDPVYLKPVWEAVDRLPQFDEALPLEILVKATFHDDHEEGVYAHDDVIVTPLALVYDRRWVHDSATDTWRDQGPWAVELWARRGELPRALQPGETASHVPRLEIEADLADLDDEEKKLVHRVFAADPKGRRVHDVDRVLLRLVTEPGRCRVDFVTARKYRELPERSNESRRRRKAFVVHLALCRLLGIGLSYEEAAIRRYYPEFPAPSGKKTLTAAFKYEMRTRIDRGFALPFTGKGEKPCEIHDSKETRTFELRLATCAAVLRLRL
jgi:hypothetical protein